MLYRCYAQRVQLWMVSESWQQIVLKLMNIEECVDKMKLLFRF